MAKRHKLLQNSHSILWWQSTLMPADLKTHRKPSFIFCSPLLPMGGRHLDCCTLTGWIQIWFGTPTESITGLMNKQDQSEQIREIYRVLALYRNMWNIKDTLPDFVSTGASKPQDVLSLTVDMSKRNSCVYEQLKFKSFRFQSWLIWPHLWLLGGNSKCV